MAVVDLVVPVPQGEKMGGGGARGVRRRARPVRGGGRVRGVREAVDAPQARQRSEVLRVDKAS